MKTITFLLCLLAVGALADAMKIPLTLQPSGSNTLDNGTQAKPWRTNNANQGSFKVGTDTGVGSGTNGRAQFYDMSGAKYSQIEAPGAVIITNTIRLPMSTNAGITVMYWAADGVLQMTNIQPGVGQILTFNGSSIVASNQAGGGGSGTPAGGNFEVQYNGAGVFAASSNFKWIGSVNKLAILNPTVSSEVDILGEGFITQATGGAAGLAFGTGVNTNILISYLGTVSTRAQTGIGTNIFEVWKTNGVPVVTVNSNGALVASLGGTNSLGPTAVDSTLTVVSNLSIGTLDNPAMVAISNNTAALPSFSVHASNNPTSVFLIRSNGNTIIRAQLSVGSLTPTAYLDVTNAPGTTVTPLAHIGTNSTGGFNVSTNGNVGIGTNAPDSKFTVNGSSHIFLNSTAALQSGVGVGVLSINPLDAIQIGTDAGANSTLADSAVQLGYNAGNRATNAQYGVYIGRHAGSDATNSANSVHVGHASGQFAYSDAGGVNVGYLAGQFASSDFESVHVGHGAGQFASNSTYSVMVGYLAGNTAWFTASEAIHIGPYAGQFATNADSTIYIGRAAGYNVNRSSTLVIDSHPTWALGGTNALLYGLIDNRELRLVNQSVTIKTNTVGIGTVSPLDRLHVVGGIVQTNGGIWQTFTFSAPSAPATQGAVYWNDGTNICAVFKNSAGTLSTNRLSMTAWP